MTHCSGGNPTLPCIPCSTLPNPTLPYPTLPCHTLPCLALSYLTLPYSTWPLPEFLNKRVRRRGLQQIFALGYSTWIGTGIGCKKRKGPPPHYGDLIAFFSARARCEFQLCFGSAGGSLARRGDTRAVIGSIGWLDDRSFYPSIDLQTAPQQLATLRCVALQTLLSWGASCTALSC